MYWVVVMVAWLAYSPAVVKVVKKVVLMAEMMAVALVVRWEWKDVELVVRKVAWKVDVWVVLKRQNKGDRRVEKVG